ncbi:threonine--tRNA ligase [Methermicoccus shengliensis]|uniref:Threonine--tRNA ligase n=1 Tax=Methermicoccus shengliensis TaxID=660064 RepID=A0A832VMH8_9EURY|nr:threonine--tRNA ligase [Methermicoccus shengliensis]KUK05188.1 MAG: Threonine--tRNA ligase [Euryarchaeota archaeon 55_53]KUK30807.1 MAG: Threonine--tRNA ligase [Methanosarcinales archeaon 56_1174]MDI3487348.1 threonyl-tRNA synthetase [Methanosarcinales archaeon]MDN5294578.1 threonyl-tRNA synthetase [Methanosarcinales archaeon]HIH69286.1 threonine--tRNA ligase [Methermicoccus shengliensis]
MRLLLIHCDYMEYEVKKRTGVAEDIDDASRAGRMEEALTVFTAVEKGDEADIEEVARRALENIEDVAHKVNTSNIVLYPYAHLSSSLSSPEAAMHALRIMEEQLASRGYTVMRAPFGWYKAFRLSCKGHPLSELSKTIELERHAKSVSIAPAGRVDVPQALTAEERLVSSFYILTPEGELVEPERFDFADHQSLKKFLTYETEKKRAVDRIPPHVELMKRLELVDYEEGSDSGNLRYYPKGRLIKGLLEQFVLQQAAQYGAMEVETPIMYDMNHPTLRRYLDRFPARQYAIATDKKMLFLRFAACFGQFLMSHDMVLSHRHLPLKMFELTRYSFRLEKRGELVGLRRLRAFTMPDMHTLCRDMTQAMEEFYQQYHLCMRTLESIGLGLQDYEVAVRMTREFYEENREFVASLARAVQKPVLLELWSERPFYFVLKFEFNFIDALDKASALSTVQIDVENAERYDITYTDEDGSLRHPIILHCSPSGAIERCMYALLERAHLCQQDGRLPTLPTWLSPTQLRIIPVSEEHVDYALSLLDRLQGVRVDVDDREESVGKKVREAGVEWIPYVAVVGEKERKSGLLSITVRSLSERSRPHIEQMSPEELRNRIMRECEGLPTRPLSMSTRLSERPRFK